MSTLKRKSKGPQWFVIYTKSRNEKKVAERLTDMGFEIYCPLVKTVKQWSDRKKKVEEPLLRSYVFVFIEEHLREGVFEVPGVVRYLYWLGKPAVVKQEEIDAMKKFLKEIPTENIKLDFEKYDEVEVKSGAFAGQTGRFLYQNGNEVVLQLESLGTVVKVNIGVESL
jgi:transcription antitermination factor NusG